MRHRAECLGLVYNKKSDPYADCPERRTEQKASWTFFTLAFQVKSVLSPWEARIISYF